MKKGYMLFKEVLNINGNKIGFNDGCVLIQLNTNERLAGRHREYENAVGMSIGEIIEKYIEFVYTSHGINDVTSDDVLFEYSDRLENWGKENVGLVYMSFIVDINKELQDYTRDFFHNLLIEEYGVDVLSAENYIENDYYIDEEYDSLIFEGYQSWCKKPAETYLERIDEIIETTRLSSEDIEIISELKLWPQNEIHKDWNLIERWYYSRGTKFDYDKREDQIKQLLNNENLSDEDAEFLAYLNYRFVGNFYLKPWKKSNRVYCIGLSSKKEQETLRKKYSKSKSK